MLNIIDACKKLARIELNNGSIVKVFPDLAYEDIPIVEYNIADGINGIAIDKEGNEHKIADCTAFSLDGKKINLNVVKSVGNNFYELVNGDDLKYFTNIHEYGDGETWRLFNDYAQIKSLDLTNITSLPSYTLFRCNKLRSLEIPSGLTYIETYSIASCDGLQSLTVDDNNPVYTSKDSHGNECNCIIDKATVGGELDLIQGCNVSTIPDNTTKISSGAFDECTGIHSITIPNTVREIGDNVFRGCTGLNTKVTIPSAVESIGNYTFKGCNNLPAVECNVENISEQLFKDCTSLSSVTLNNTVSVDNQAFMNCSSLQNIEFPDTLVSAGTSCFANSGLRSVNTNRVGTISQNMFAGCTNLSSVTFDDEYTTIIGVNAFSGCTLLENLTVSENITDIKRDSFSGCDNLTNLYWNSINYNGTTAPFSSGYNGLFENVEFGENVQNIPNSLCSGMNIISIAIPDNVENIGSYCFDSCNILRTVYIGENNTSITEIPSSCFLSCVSLETVYITSEIKIDLASPDAFADCPNLTEIIVPDNLVQTYRESEDWAPYKDIIFGRTQITVTFDANGGETAYPAQTVRLGAKLQFPGTEHKDLHEFNYWETEDGDEWDFNTDVPYENMTLYANYDFIKALMVKSDSNDVTSLSMSYYGSYPANVEYSFDGRNWHDWPNEGYANKYISLSEGYNNYIYFRGYNPNGFSRDWSNYTKFNINNGQCDLFGNLMYLKDYNNLVNSIGYYEFLYCFQNCYALRNCDKLTLFASGATLATYCYYGMFRGCTALETTPVLPATTLASSCYSSMFSNCTSLTTLPDNMLPATTLTEGCYVGMFEGCTSLTTAPELPATTLASYCYQYIFYNCTSLNYIKCLATNISASLCTNDWVNGVANSGIFVKHPDVSENTWGRGDNGIPINWTVEDAVIEKEEDDDDMGFSLFD